MPLYSIYDLSQLSKSAFSCLGMTVYLGCYPPSSRDIISSLSSCHARRPASSKLWLLDAIIFRYVCRYVCYVMCNASQQRSLSPSCPRTVHQKLPFACRPPALMQKNLQNYQKLIARESTTAPSFYQACRENYSSSSHVENPPANSESTCTSKM